jgi:hypothetical protein
MRGKVSWYPNADGNKCPGSFRATTQRGYADGVKGKCPVCGRLVGFRNRRSGQLAQHRKPSPLKAVIAATEPRRNVTVQGGVPDVLLNMDFSAIEHRLCAAAAAGSPTPSPSPSGSPTGLIREGNHDLWEYAGAATGRWSGHKMHVVDSAQWLRQARAAARFAERMQAAAIRCGAHTMVHDEITFYNPIDANRFWLELQLLTEVENFEGWQAEAHGEAVGKAAAFRAAHQVTK